MTQPALLAATAPSLPPNIDLRCCGVVDMLASLDDGCADLVIADPPWTYNNAGVRGNAADQYALLGLADIAGHVAASARVGRRLALWTTWPLLSAWMSAAGGWGAAVSGGSWFKSGPGDAGHFGPGFHWAGCSEPVLLYTRDGAHTESSVPLRNAWHEPPGEHSRKPVGWQAQWIRRWVPPGGLVVDLYAGLGSVAEAVLLAGDGRRYVGAEIDPDRHAQAMALVSRVRPAQVSLFGRAA